MKYTAIIAAGLVLAGCVSSGPSQYVLEMQRYQGVSEARLIDELGPPDRIYEVEGTRYLTYTKASQQIYPIGSGAYGGYGYGRSGRYGFGYDQSFGDTAAVQTYRCDVFFALRNHRVTKIGHRGNAC